MPNKIQMVELETRWDYADSVYKHSIPESFRIDQSKQSLFGASKVTAEWYRSMVNSEVMIKDLPRILIVSEVAFSKDCRGIARTLLNLFESYPAEHLAFFSPMKSDLSASLLNQQFFYCPERFLPPLYGRYAPIGRLMNPLIKAVNLQLLEWLPVPNQKNLELFLPETILICPNTAWGLVMGKKLSNHFQCPFLIYFMDDWIATDQSQWLSASVQRLAYQLLKESAGWLMISEQLQETLSKRYQLVPKQSVIVHNPVDLSEKRPPSVETQRIGTFKIIYAGSIWPMHYDALAATAEAVFQLRCDGKDIELVLHTDEYFWNYYKEKWQLWQVTYGTLIPYHQLDSHLKHADLLLVVSSFLPEYSFMTRSSVQTKITDYMASGTPILSCGPEYSACNQFIRKWNCGIVHETSSVLEIKNFLIKQINNRYSNQRFAKTAFEVLKNDFEKSKVSNKLYEFIENIS